MIGSGADFFCWEVDSNDLNCIYCLFVFFLKGVLHNNSWRAILARSAISLSLKMHISIQEFKLLSAALRSIPAIVKIIIITITLKTSSRHMQDSRSQCSDVDYLWNHKNLESLINYNLMGSNKSNNQLIFNAKQHQRIAVIATALIIRICLWNSCNLNSNCKLLVGRD